MVLIKLFIYGGDLALAKGIIECIVTIAAVLMPRREAVARSMTSDASRPRSLLIGVDVRQDR